MTDLVKKQNKKKENPKLTNKQKKQHHTDKTCQTHAAHNSGDIYMFLYIYFK